MTGSDLLNMFKLLSITYSPKDSVYKIPSSLPKMEDFNNIQQLVLYYIKCEKDYCASYNSITKGSITIKRGCELYSWKDYGRSKAVVHVKGPEDNEVFKSSDYEQFVKDGYDVYLYCPEYIDDLKSEHVIRITEDELLDFVNENRNKIALL